MADPSDQVSLPDSSQTAEQASEDPYYDFPKIDPSPEENSEQHSAPSTTQSIPENAPPSSYAAAAPAEHDQTVQQETAEVDDPLYNFLKNILPQVATQHDKKQATEPDMPSVPAASSDPVNPSYPAEHVETTPQKFSDEGFFLNISPPPKPRSLGFPQITNTRDNVIQQNNWSII